jgi:hypothetical protein
VGAQQSDQKIRKPAKSSATVNKEAELLRSNAIYLLRRLAQSGNEIENIPDRVRTLAEIGDVMWAVDRDDARAALVHSFQEIDKLTTTEAHDGLRVANQKRFLRGIVLSRIAKHDPALVNQLIHDLPSEPATVEQKQRQLEGVASPNGDALLAIADNLLASDPKRAIALAMYSLQDGLSQRLRLFLIELRSTNPAAADTLAEAALRQASTYHPARLFDVMLLWDYVYQPHDFYLNGIVLDREQSDPRYQSSPSLKRAVLGFGVNAVMENLQQFGVDTEPDQDKRFVQPQTAALYSVIQQLLPSMQADFPQGAISLQQALARVSQELQSAGQTFPQRPEIRNDAESTTTLVDKLLEKADAASQGEARDSLYLGASFKLLQLRKYERAKEIAAKIDDLEQRATVVDPVNFYLAGEFIEKGDLNEALRIASQLKTPELRISRFADIARGFIKEGESQRALEAVSEVRNSASKAEPTIEISAATLRLASALIKFDLVQASEVIGLAIQLANKTKDENQWSLMSPTGSTNTLTFSWKNAPGGGLKSVTASYSRNGGLAELLTKVEFDRAVAIAREIRSKGVSIAAQAVICRAAIESTEPKIAAGREQ